MNLKLIARFPNRDLAWRFMRACDELDIKAGFPSLGNIDGKGYSVRYEAKQGDLIRIKLHTYGSGWAMDKLIKLLVAEHATDLVDISKRLSVLKEATGDLHWTQGRISAFRQAIRFAYDCSDSEFKQSSEGRNVLEMIVGWGY